MANSKISALTSATTPLAGTEVLPIVQSSATVKATVENVFNATQPSGTAFGVVALDTNKRPVTSTGLKYQSSSLGINIGANTPGYTTEVVGSFRYQDTFAQNGYEFAAGSTNIITSYNRTTGTWLALRQRGLSHEFYCNGTSTVNIDSVGNIVPQIAARGVKFTANTPAAGMTSQLLNWYEEGTFTPNQGAGLTLVGAFSSTGKYTRIGRQVSISGTVTGATSVAVTAAGVVTSNLPFTVGTAGHGDATNAAVNVSASIICTGTSVTAAGAITATATITFSATYFV